MSVETSTSLKETIFTQQKLLQKLYNELEVERESSATAASEALSMILRLQGEKAAVKMESEHYKRLAEEKIYHAEESMEVFEDLIQQKEMEIANLDYQVQAYRYKLSSLGLEDTGPHETKFPESLLQISERETSPEGLLRRNSAPPKLLKLAYLKRGSFERSRSASPDSDIERLDENQNMDSDKQTYWDQIRKLDKIVEEMAKESETGQSQQKSTDEMVSDTCNLSVLDVFEVPETNESLDFGKSVSEDESKIEKVSTFIDDQDSIKSCKKTLFLNKKDNNIVVDCRMAVNVVEGEGSSQQVNTTSEITKGDDNVSSREPVVIRGREDEMLRLLYEINRKLDCIQAKSENGKFEEKKPSSNYDLPMLQLQEAMLHFWM